MKVMLEHLKRLGSGQIDPFQLQEWQLYQGLPIILVPFGDELMVYAVERLSENGEQNLKISVMFAGVRSQGYHGLEGTWDGSDESLWQIVAVRCHLYFKN